MLVGVPKEIKTQEYRVGLVPSSVRELVHHGHQVIIETNAGAGVGFFNEDYERAGATIAADAAEVFAKAGGLGRHRHRLRDGDRSKRPPAAPGADE